MADLTVSRWLRKQPPAFKVRATLEDGAERMISLDPKDPRRWGKCSDALIALRAVKVEKLDKEGDTIAVMMMEDEQQAEDRELAREKKKHADESERVQIARLLVESADKSAARHEAAYRVAFDMIAGMATKVLDSHNKQVSLINGILRRIEGMAQTTEPDGVPGMLQMVMGMRTGAPGPMGGPQGVIAAAQRASQQANGHAPPVASTEPGDDDDQGDEAE